MNLLLIAAWLVTLVHGEEDSIEAACSTPAYGACGNDKGIVCCPNKYYCQPWSSGYYQCMPNPSKCSKLQTNVEFTGNDIKTVRGLQPEACCLECAQTAGCKAYTFVNSAPGSTACYLKTAEGGHEESPGAVSGLVVK